MNQKNELWILKPERRDYIFYKIKRDKNWNKIINFHTSRELKVTGKQIQRAFDNAFRELES
ncbi:MAG: hypothetical protein ABIJ92_05485 [Candidatus Aenigmatarchaeota archaeon]